MKLQGLKNISDKMNKYTKYEPPQPVNKNLPATYGIFLSSSVKGSGKSFNMVLLMQEYSKEEFVATDGTKVQLRIIYISGGTSRSKQNSILDTLDKLHDDDRIDLEENVDAGLKKIYDEILEERDEVDSYKEYIKIYNKFIKNVSKLTYDELNLLHFKKYVNPKYDDDRPKCKNGNILENPQMIFIILDDMVLNQPN